MKLLLQLSIAVLLVASTMAARNTGSLKDFLSDPQIASVAPHLVQQISIRGVETSSAGANEDSSPNLPAGKPLPLLQDIIEIVSQTVFNPKDDNNADWSRLEAAKMKAIQTHGAEAVIQFANLTAIDTHRASLIVNTIYDTVVHLPASSKATYTAKAAQAKTSSFWDFIGFGLLKSSDAVRNVKSIVTPQDVCDTTDQSYLNDAEEIVYYSSLTDGIAGGTIAAMPNDSAAKSLGLGFIITSIGKLAVEIHMAQSIARLADMNPFDDHVRAMVLLALAADSASSDSAQMAKDIFRMKSRGIANKIPSVVLKSLEQQAALVLITKGAGHVNAQSTFPNMPVVRNIFAFSSDVLSANNVGDVLKYVFCPGKADELWVEGQEGAGAGDAVHIEAAEVKRQMTKPKKVDKKDNEDEDYNDDEDEDENEGENIDEETEGEDEDEQEDADADDVQQDGGQKVLAMPHDPTAKNAAEDNRQEL